MVVAVKVSNLPPDATHKDLYGFFSYAGTITSIHVAPGDKEESAGVAYVAFLEERALETALLLSEGSIKGNIVSVVQAEAEYSPPQDAKFFSQPVAQPLGKSSIKVSNLAPGTTVRDVYDFFSYAGTICSVHLQPASEAGPGIAHVNFMEEKALDTALLLSEASIKGSIVIVESVVDYTPPSDAKFYPLPGQGGGGGESPFKKAESMVRRLVDQGYELGKDTAHKAREFDEKHQLLKTASTRFTELKDGASTRLTELKDGASKLDQRLSISRSFAAGAERVDRAVASMDEKYNVTEKTRSVFSQVEAGLTSAGEYLMQNKYVAQGKDWMFGTAEKVSDFVEGSGEPRPTAAASDSAAPAAPSAAAAAAAAPEPASEAPGASTQDAPAPSPAEATAAPSESKLKAAVPQSALKKAAVDEEPPVF